ncbi:two-component system, OmpR family, sensor histidine kinase ResE [Amphibacillus marinus]|uniref:histidine kinase n=1 Tax=Amphibacillus marinus TaxID=872970 RepID=A0A1H8GC52_9BACI|nr:ATP-binding protein [Amphibacillus marinus]SEN41626.1 two-component system, OmpR family, sensor histidine kinase ResE [Amphibacillus marinus]
MIWRHRVWKIWLVTLSIFIVVFAVFSYFLTLQANNQALEDANEQLTVYVEGMHNLYLNGDWPLDGYELSYPNQTTIMISGPSTAAADILSEFNQSIDVMQDSGTIAEQIVIHNQEMLAVAMIESELVVVAYQPIAMAIEAYRSVLWSPITVFTIVLLAITLLAYLLNRSISRPLQHFRKLALEMATGETVTKMPIEAHDEFGELSMAFNRMVRQLNNRISGLLHEKHILHSVIGSMRDGVMTMNLDGDIFLINDQAKRFLADANFESNHNGLDRLPEKLNEYLALTISEQTVKVYSLIIQGRNWELVMAPLYEDQRIRGVVSIVRDTTEQYQLNQLRESFIANVSHELRTPIALMQGYSEAIVDGVAETINDQRELAAIIRDESLRMGRLVNDLLNLAKMKSGQLQLDVKQHDVTKFLNRIKRKFLGMVTDKAITFKISLDPDACEGYFDYDRLEQVLTNLIDNGIRHTASGGSLRLKVINSKRFLEFKLSDTGSGIPEQDLPFIFERFYMADKSRAKNSNKKGTGLGLAIAKQIVNAHGGEITVQSILSKGTTFKFTIPNEV